MKIKKNKSEKTPKLRIFFKTGFHLGEPRVGVLWSKLTNVSPCYFLVFSDTYFPRFITPKSSKTRYYKNKSPSLSLFLKKWSSLRLVGKIFFTSSHSSLSLGNFLGARGCFFGAGGPVKVEKNAKNRFYFVTFFGNFFDFFGVFLFFGSGGAAL